MTASGFIARSRLSCVFRIGATETSSRIRKNPADPAIRDEFHSQVIQRLRLAPLRQPAAGVSSRLIVKVGPAGRDFRIAARRTSCATGAKISAVNSGSRAHRSRQTAKFSSARRTYRIPRLYPSSDLLSGRLDKQVPRTGDVSSLRVSVMEEHCVTQSQ